METIVRVVGAVALLALAACSDAEVSAYPPHDEIDPGAEPFFTELEDDGSDPLTYAGGLELWDVEQQFLWETGVDFCEDLDTGTDFGTAFDRMEDDHDLGSQGGRLAAAAVIGLCDQHLDAADAWVRENA